METRRLFFAVPVTRTVREVLQELQEDVADVFGRRGMVQPDAFHLTLRFLGSVRVDRLEDLTDAVRSSLEETVPAELSLKGLATFGRPEAPRVVVVTLAPEKPVASIAERIEEAVTGMGFLPEKRPFRAHITIQRPKKPGRLRPRPLSEGVPLPVDRVVLYESQLRPDRAHYVPVAVFPLQEGR